MEKVNNNLQMVISIMVNMLKENLMVMENIFGKMEIIT
jgi:hypothetical protein